MFDEDRDMFAVFVRCEAPVLVEESHASENRCPMRIGWGRVRGRDNRHEQNLLWGRLGTRTGDVHQQNLWQYASEKHQLSIHEVREKVSSEGPTVLSDDDLLDLALGNIAIREEIGEHSLHGLLRADPSELTSHLTGSRSLQIMAILELSRRINLPPESRIQIRCADDAFRLLSSKMSHLDHEELHVLSLASKNHVLANQILYKETVNSSDIRIAEVFRMAVLRKSPAIILAHCDPSGDTDPSPEDIEVTWSIVKAGELLGIDVLDHLIIGCDRYISLKEKMGW